MSNKKNKADFKDCIRSMSKEQLAAANLDLHNSYFNRDSRGSTKYASVKALEVHFVGVDPNVTSGTINAVHEMISARL